MVDLQPITTPDQNNNFSRNTSEQSSPSSSSPTSPRPPTFPVLLQYPLPPSSTSFTPIHFQEPMFSSSPYLPFHLPPYCCVYSYSNQQPPLYICRPPELLYPSIPTTLSVLSPFNGGTQLIAMDGSVVYNTQNDGVLLQAPSIPAGGGYRIRKRSSQKKPRATWDGNGEERRVRKEGKSRQKVKTLISEHASGSQPSPPLRRPIPPPPYSGHLSNCTTVMVKNIPNSLSRRDLMDMLDSHCLEHNPKAAYDFLYLPFDFYYEQNLGYAFVNFTTAEGAATLSISWNGTGWPCWTYSSKICQITCAKLQGLERCKRHFEVSHFRCHSRTFLPVEFSPPRDGSNGGDCKMTLIGRWFDANPKHCRSKTIISSRLG